MATLPLPSLLLLALALALALAPGCAAPSHPGGPAERSTSVDGAAVHSVETGAGSPTLVFLHGWAGDLRLWSHQLTGLSSSARLLAVDLPGHGRSDPPTGPVSLAAFADTVVAVLDDAGVDRAVLVGHSIGAAVALTVLRRHPERVAGLVVIDGWLRNVLEDSDRRRAWIANFSGPDAVDNTDDYLRSSMGPLEDPAARALILDAARGVAPGMLEASLEAAFDPIAWSTEPVDVPLLTIVANARIWSAEYQAFVRRLAPQVDWQVISRSGHWVMLQHPQPVNRHIADWLAANARVLR